jgi:hypothetical protein
VAKPLLRAAGSILVKPLLGSSPTLMQAGRVGDLFSENCQRGLVNSLHGLTKISMRMETLYFKHFEIGMEKPIDRFYSKEW